jgi:ATP-dependent 26S proteasome regulatory subunit
MFLICLAPALDLRYERLYGFLQDDVTRRRPQVSLVLDLLCEPGPDRWQAMAHLAGSSPLFRHRLVQHQADGAAGRTPLLGRALWVDPALDAWLHGQFTPAAEIRPFAALQRVADAEPDPLLPAGVGAELERAQAAGQPILAFFGPDQAGQQAAAEYLARQAGQPLLRLDLAAAVDGDLPARQAVELALRDARLAGALPVIAGWDVALDASDGSAAGLLPVLYAHPGLSILTARRRWQPRGVAGQRPQDATGLFWIEFDMPDFAQRRALWAHFLAGGTGRSFECVPALAGQFQLTTSQIRDAVVSAQDRAAQRDGAVDEQDLYAAARLHSNPNLAELARKIEPRYDWDDIVLPQDQLSILREIVSTVRGRPQVLEEWGVGRKLVSSAGVTVLFAGPPGTGKTMSAEVIAGELGLDLFKIDLSTVVSKYIGETEKNLEKIFDEAKSSNAILFFDEADAIFGKRSEVKDAHDRYANIEVSYLLQRMEAYDGVTILATNLRANLDEAFTRRLQFAVDFPFPEVEDRRRIWTTLFPAGVPRDAEIDFDLLARRFKLTGGNIRNIIVSAAYLAAGDGGRVTMEHLLHGTRRELQKMGRLVNPADLEPASDDRPSRTLGRNR